MVSSALRLGTSKHLEPHHDQYIALTKKALNDKKEPETPVTRQRLLVAKSAGLRIGAFDDEAISVRFRFVAWRPTLRSRVSRLAKRTAETHN